MGTVIVGSLLITGALNYWLIVGPTVTGLFSTPYGQLLIAKLVLFGMMLALLNDLKTVNYESEWFSALHQ